MEQVKLMGLDDDILPKPPRQSRGGKILHPGLDQQEGPAVGERYENRFLHENLVSFLIKTHP